MRENRGLFYGVAAYGIWGMFPIFWPLLAPASPLEILAHRVAWSLAFLALFNSLRGRWPSILAVLRDGRLVRQLIAAAILISVNWGLYIWAINSGHIIDASFGYFMNPLINVLLGILLFNERLNLPQRAAVIIAATGVLWMAIDAGTLPWIGLVLAFSFAGYGAVKKRLQIAATDSLSVETILLGPVAVVYLLWLEATGAAAFLHEGVAQALASIAAGPVTAVPLVFFAAAAKRLPYSTLGVVQYMTPTMQFLLGWLVFNEAMSSGKWIGFALVWVALVVFTFDAVRQGRSFATSDD